MGRLQDSQQLPDPVTGVLVVLVVLTIITIILLGMFL